MKTLQFAQRETETETETRVLVGFFLREMEGPVSKLGLVNEFGFGSVSNKN